MPVAGHYGIGVVPYRPLARGVLSGKYAVDAPPPADTRAGRLVHLLSDWGPYYPGACLYYPANRHPPMALRMFEEAVRAWARE